MFQIGNKWVNDKVSVSTANENGFTFVEVLVTVSVLSLGLVLIFQSFYISIACIKHLNDRIEARVFMEDEIVRFKMAMGEDPSVSDDYVYSKQEGTDPFYNIRVESGQGGYDDTIRVIDASVLWNEDKKNNDLEATILVYKALE